MNDDQVISDIHRKIERERALINGATTMRGSTNNPAIQSQTDNQIREARRNIDYLESRLREVEMRRMGHGVGNMSLGTDRASSNQQGQRYGNGPSSSSPYSPHGGYGSNEGGYGNPGPGGYQDQLSGGTNSSMPPRAPFPPGGPGANAQSSKARPTYSKLDLIKYDTPHLGPRIQLMLTQLEFKLSVEKQYKDGVEKIIGSYSANDRNIVQQAQSRRIESIQKIQLLKRALKRYEDLHIDAESSQDAADDDSLNAPSMRKPLTGHLTLKVNAVSDVNHAATGRLSRGPETFVIMKVEDDFKGRTKATRTEKWTDETHEIDIDKGNEIEVCVYDKGTSEHPIPIGLLWIRISDIAEEMRRKKIEMEYNNSGWVSADQTMNDYGSVRPDLQFNPPPGQAGNQAGGMMGGGLGGAGGQGPQQQVTIESWFSLEPVGRINLAMSFTKQTREVKHFDAGLNRKGAIRQRKEDVHELYGHKFIAQQFYNIMRCALCGELLKYAVGMQCSDCKYMCHEKCYSQVVTKCISKSNAETDPDEAKLNHRIPHRFEPFGNMGANWCCHCGYILPLGRKNCRRCKECKNTCHTHCTHLVPDFCGMSMKDANRILSEIKNVNNRAPRTTLRPQRPRPQVNAAPSYQVGQQDQTSASSDRLSYGNETPSDETGGTLTQTSTSSSTASSQALGAAAGAFNISNAGNAPQAQRQPSDNRRPQPNRTESSQSALAAAAATHAIMGKQTSPTQTTSRPPLYPMSSGQGQGRMSSGYPTPASNASAAKASQPPPQHSTYDPSQYANFQQAQQPPRQPMSPAQQQQPYSPPQIVEQQPQQPVAKTPANQFLEQKHHPSPSQTRGSGRRIGLDHFNFLSVLGKGNFGKVMLAETKATKQLYAIKVLKKEFIIENDEVESTKSERDVFIIANRARHPFLLSLHACFQTETRVYFVMEYISGGDLMLHIQRGSFGTKRAQFYAAEVCLALKYFHENGVIYRDLKLDNILLAMDGHIKIADYGLCKKDMYYGSNTSTFCGTPEFMAPEILLDKKYSRAVDWWAFGVLIYQMLLQQSPFRGEDEDEIYDAILADEPLYPIHMPRDSVSILQKLLTREPELRLGSGPTDAQEIMSHAFFRNINWDDIQEKKIPAPFMPQIKSPTDTSNFDSEFTSVTPVLTPVQSVLSQAMQEEFRGFSYTADFV